jgi:uncharacterized delta-60 repeat protein
MQGLVPRLAVVAVLALGLAAPGVAAGAAGDRDPSFGAGGFTILDDPVAAGELLTDLVLLPDGKVVGGGLRGASQGFLLARFNANGSPDAGFGAGGISALPYSGMDGQTRAIARLDVQPDGKILAAGLGSQTATDAFAITRYTADGAGLDPGFNGGAPVVFRPANESSDAFDVDSAPAGKVVAVGEIKPGGVGQVAVVRRTDSGAPDMSFSGDGEIVIDLPGGSEQALAVEVLADGSMLVAGSAASGAFLLKLTEAGALDGGFGGGGFAIRDLGSSASPSGNIQDVHVLPDGRILATGDSDGPGSLQFFAARFTASGDLDPTFATGGVLRRDPTAADDAGSALAVLPDGRIVIAGYRNFDDPTAGGDTWLQRLTPDGALDPSFGSGGETIASAVPGDDAAYGLAIDPIGRALIAGTAPDPQDRLLVGRFLGDPNALPPPPILDPDLRELELFGRRLTPFTVTCAQACAAEAILRSRRPLRLPHASTHRRRTVTIGRATLAPGVSGRRTVRMRATALARRILRRRPVRARLAVTVATDGGSEKAVQNILVRPAQRRLVVNRRGRGRLRVVFRAEADSATRGSLTLKLGRRIAARTRFSPAPGRSVVVPVRLNERAQRRLGSGAARRMKLSLRYRLDTGRRVLQSRRLLVLRAR